MMFAGRHPGSRTLQGLTIKAQLEKLCAAAAYEQERHAESAHRNRRIKTIQNLASAILITVASTVTVSLTLDGTTRRWPAIWLAASATLCNLVVVTRRHPEKEKAHLQMAKRYAAFGKSCLASVTKYEEGLIEDSELRALLDQHLSEIEALKKEPEPV